MPKEAVFTLKLESDLRDAFLAEAASTHRPASQLVREFMRDFVQKQQEAREHDQWFRAQVQEALDDPRPSIPNDAVKAKTRALLDRIAARKAKG
jgi:predicted transcriptional regulator